MVAVIWFVQWVHYPLFAHVGADSFSRYEAAHVSRITPLVMIPMLIELGTGIALALRQPSLPGVWAGVGFIAFVWLVTFFLSVPAHQALSTNFDGSVLRRLVATNWLRTAAWTGRGVLCVWWLSRFVEMRGS